MRMSRDKATMGSNRGQQSSAGAERPAGSSSRPTPMLQLKSSSLSSKATPFLALGSFPPFLRPLIRAYILGYASAVVPRLVTLILQHISRRRLGKKKFRSDSPEQSKPPTLAGSAIHVLKTGLEIQRFPAFCAVLAGGASLLQQPVSSALGRLQSASRLSHAARLRLSRWLSTFIAAWLGLRLLQSKQSPTAHGSSSQRRRDHDDTPADPTATSSTSNSPPKALGEAPRLAGRTLDLTLFAATRAIDVIAGELWTRRRAHRQAANKWTSVEQVISNSADSMLFALSSGLIMWSWFFSPSRLPRSYNKWITSAASVDLRLIDALRRCHSGELQYGQDTGQAPLLESMCADYGLPVSWGDPATAIPFPCELVHMGCGSSCEYHALSRFVRSWKWSMYTYLPLALALKLRRPSWKNLARAVLSASRSSAFLGVFITLFYYGVCLGRTRLGPSILGKHVAARQAMDGGVCVGTGCVLCGWSVLIETAGRRKDMALFVAPRAMATLLPRQYAVEKQWRETLVFAASTAVVFTCVLENPGRVRGVLGRVLGSVMKQ